MASDPDRRVILVAGGAGYIGSVLTRALLASGHRVRVLDSLLYGNGASLAAVAEDERFGFMRGDVRSPDDLRAALPDVTDVVHLAALVGDPVCKRNPELAKGTNLDGTRALLTACGDSGVERFVFASTCSNYGLRPDNTPASEDDGLQPLSLYAETKVEMEREILARIGEFSFSPTLLRVSTAFGISPRMRFDLTVSEFTRELALGRRLEVYDAETWRPYCHIADISAAIMTVLVAKREEVSGEVFNVGGEGSNQTKRSIVEAALSALDGRGDVDWAEGGVDARNYRVSFDKIRERLGFTPRHTVPGSIAELVAAVKGGMFEDVERRSLFYRNYELSEPERGGEGQGGGDAG